MHGPKLLQTPQESYTCNIATATFHLVQHAYDTLQLKEQPAQLTANTATVNTMPENVSHSVYAAFSLSALTNFPKASSILGICLLLSAIHLRRLKPLTCRSLKTQDCQGQAGALPPMHPYITSCDPYSPLLGSIVLCFTTVLGAGSVSL